MSSRKVQREAAKAQRETDELLRQAAAARKYKLALLFSGVIAACAAAAVLLVISSSDSSKIAVNGAAESNSLLSGVPQSATALGKPTAPVTLVEFGDLKCPHCRDFNNDVFPSLVKHYVKSGDLRIEFRMQAFVAENVTPGDTVNAARMALSVAKQDKFWNFVDIFYRNQRHEMTRYADDDFVGSIAGSVPGLDVEQALDGRSDPAIDSHIADATLEFHRRGMTGTPGFLLGPSGSSLERLYVSKLKFDQFTEPIDALLKK